MADIAAFADSLFSATSVNRQTNMANLAQFSLSRGADLSLKGDYDGAAREFKRAAALDSSQDNFVKAYDLLAVTYLKQDKIDEAVKAYKTSLRIAPAIADTHVKLGNVYFSQGNFVDAEKEYKMGVRLDPTSSTNQFSLGQVYLATGRYDEAENLFEKVIRMDRRHHGGYYALGQTYAKQGRYEDAIEQFEKVVALKRDFYDVHVDLGSAYADLGLTDEADAELDILDENEPGLSSLLSDYMDAVAKPKILAAYSSTGFNATLGPNTSVSSLDATLSAANATKQFDMIFIFDKPMDLQSVQNPFNWSISKAYAGAQGGSYNWGLPVPDTDAHISLVPSNVIYTPDMFTATVFFNINQNADADATLDPSHITFQFSGKDGYGNAMDASADQYNGVSKIA